MVHPENTFTILDSVDSTNNYAMAKVHAGLAKHGDAFFTMNQTNGKGQRGKQWHSANGKNITISIIIDPFPLTIPKQFNLSAMVALACLNFYGKYAGDETQIKWPNDIYWRDRKAGGILIENVIGNSSAIKSNQDPGFSNYCWKFAVVGIGLNVNQTNFDFDLNNAVSLKQITGKEFDILALAKALHSAVIADIATALQQPFENILQQYNNSLYKKNERVLLKKYNVAFNTTIKSVTEKGQLFTVDTIDNFFDFGEIEWVI